jgi:hypothetical protein
VKVRTGDASGRADLPDDLGSGHHVAFAHPDDGQMREHGEDTESVIDHDGVAGEVEITRQQDASAVWRMDGSGCRTQKIGAAVWLSRLAVENTARAERTIDAPWHGPDESAGPQPARFGLRPELLQLASLAPNTSKHRLWWVHEYVVNGEHAPAELPRRDSDFRDCPDRARWRRCLE